MDLFLGTSNLIILGNACEIANWFTSFFLILKLINKFIFYQLGFLTLYYVQLDLNYWIIQVGFSGIIIKQIVFYYPWKAPEGERIIKYLLLMLLLVVVVVIVVVVEVVVIVTLLCYELGNVINEFYFCMNFLEIMWLKEDAIHQGCRLIIHLAEDVMSDQLLWL